LEANKVKRTVTILSALNMPGSAAAVDIGKLARASARKNAAKPPATRKIEDKRRKPAKHRKPLTEE
jgi:hypothetical protein